MATVYDVARQAGVSTATVSRVVRGSDLVHPETRRRVIGVIEELGFVPNGAAQGLSRRRKDIIGLVALERGTDEIDIERNGMLFVDELVHAAESVLRGSGMSLLLSFGRRGDGFQRRIKSLSGKVDGLIMAEDVLPPDQLTALSRRLPVVLIAGPPGAPVSRLDTIAVDNAAGLAAVTSHLTGSAHGYRQLCYLSGPLDSPDARQRRAAFAAQVRAVPGCHAELPVHGDFSEASGSAAAGVLLARARLPEAVVCANDQMAIGLMREFRRAGVSVPGTVAVTGFDDIYPSRLTDPPLTTVSQPLRELGTRAARRLLAQIGTGPDAALAAAGLELPAPLAEVLPTRLIVRASCGCQGQQLRPAPRAGYDETGGNSGR